VYTERVCFIPVCTERLHSPRVLKCFIPVACVLSEFNEWTYVYQEASLPVLHNTKLISMLHYLALSKSHQFIVLSWTISVG